MNLLKQEQIDWIRADLSRRGVLYPPLREEIVDHVCDAVEAQMHGGTPFMDAYAQVLASFGPHGLTHLNQQTLYAIGTAAMFKNYFILAWRNLRRHKLPTGINLLGLVLGISSSLLIIRYVQHERSYDDYHRNAGRIYRLTTNLTFSGREEHAAFSQYTLGTRLALDYPEVEKVIRLRYNHNYRVTREKITVQVPPVPGTVGAPKLYGLDQLYYLYDPDYFQVFTHPVLLGDPRTALKEPGSVVLTESLAVQFFGSGWRTREEVLGTQLAFNGAPYRVTGVIRDVPSNTDLPFRALLRTDAKTLPERAWCTTYVLFKDEASGRSFGSKLDQIAAAEAPKYAAGGASIAYFLENLRDVHLGTPKTFDTPKADPSYLAVLSVVAGFLLLIAGINYVNLSVAQSAGRGTEVGIRKAIGAVRGQLLVQFLGESVLLTLVAVALSLLLVACLLPAYNGITGISFSLLSFFSPKLAGGVVVIFILVGLVAGSYPAWYLSSFRPVEALKGKLRFSGRSARGLLGQGLVVFQFAISVTLIIGTLVVYAQLSYLQQKSLGFRKEQVLVVDVPADPAAMRTMPGLRAALANHTAFRGVALNGSMSLPSQEMNLAEFHVQEAGSGHMQTRPRQYIDIDENYLPLLDIPVVAGRNFAPRRPLRPGEDWYSMKEVLVNEAMVREMGWGPDPRAALGKQVRQGASHDESMRGTVIGVVKDFHFHSLHTPIAPLVITNNAVFFPEKVLIRLSAGVTKAQVQLVEQEWKKRVPDHPFVFSFLDQTFDRQYRQERRLGPLFTYFSGLTIFVACLGLFGLVSFATRQRTKEVGIRKVLGAGEGGLVLLLSREFLLLVGVAILLASPLAWWAMHQWLQGFAYRTSITWWMFAGAGGVAVLVAALTTGYHAFRAARAHPVQSLRYE